MKTLLTTSNHRLLVGIGVTCLLLLRTVVSGDWPGGILAVLALFCLVWHIVNHSQAAESRSDSQTDSPAGDSLPDKSLAGKPVEAPIDDSPAVGGDSETGSVTADRADVSAEAATMEFSAESAASGELMLANFSHEVRNALSSIVGMTQLLLKESRSGQREYLTIISQAAQSLMSLVNDSLEFAKIRHGQIELAKKPIEVAAFVAETCRLLAWNAHVKKLELLFDIGDDVPESMHADPLRLRQVLLNLVGNAIKFTRQGEVVVRVCRHSTERVEFLVCDTGPGIPTGDQQQIFEPFHRTQKDVQGSGLGLWISNQLVRHMDGEMTVESEVGRGSTFRFHMPIGEKPSISDDFDDLREFENMPRSWDNSLLELRVVIVDDNATVRELLTSQLEALAAQVTVATSVADARAGVGLGLQEIGAWVLIDAELDHAFEFAAHLQAAGQFPVMMLTASNQPRQAERCRELQITRQLLKPFHADELWDILKRAQVAPSEVPAVPQWRHEWATENSLFDLASPAQLGELSEWSEFPGDDPVLVVDDDPLNRRFVVRLIEQQGFRTHEASDGETAWQMLQDQKYFAVIIDFSMPRLDGVETTKRIRQASFGERLPVIGLTAHTAREHHTACLEAGMDACLLKPVRVEQLLNTLYAACAIRHLSDAPDEGAPGRSESDRQQSATASAESDDAATDDARQDVTSHDAADYAAGEEPAVHWETALETCNGDRELLRDLGELMLTECPKLLAQLQSRRASIGQAENPQGVVAEIRRAAHTLKGTLKHFGARRAVVMAGTLETFDLKEAAIWDSQFAQFQAELARVLADVRQRLTG